MSKRIETWQCETCNEVYDDELEANMCEMLHRFQNTIGEITDTVETHFAIPDLHPTKEQVNFINKITEQVQSLNNEIKTFINTSKRKKTVKKKSQ